MHKSRLDNPNSYQWAVQVSNWLQALQTDTTRLWRRVPGVPDNDIGIVPQYDPIIPDDGGNGGGGPSVIRFKNASGLDVPEFGLMQISGAILDSVTGEHIVTVIRPDVFGCQHGVIVNGDAVVAPGAIGEAQITGAPVRMLYSGGSPLLGQIWGPRSGTWMARSATGGFRIAGNADGTAVVATHAPWLTFRGKTTAVVAATTFGNITIYMTYGVTSSTGVTVAAYNPYDEIDTDKWVTCAWMGTGWEIITAEC